VTAVRGHLLATMDGDACHMPCCLAFLDSQCHDSPKWFDTEAEAREALK
jgi:hypothetical protein